MERACKTQVMHPVVKSLSRSEQMTRGYVSKASVMTVIKITKVSYFFPAPSSRTQLSVDTAVFHFTKSIVTVWKCAIYLFPVNLLQTRKFAPSMSFVMSAYALPDAYIRLTLFVNRLWKNMLRNFLA